MDHETWPTQYFPTIWNSGYSTLNRTLLLIQIYNLPYVIWQYTNGLILKIKLHRNWIYLNVFIINILKNSYLISFYNTKDDNNVTRVDELFETSYKEQPLASSITIKFRIIPVLITALSANGIAERPKTLFGCDCGYVLLFGSPYLMCFEMPRCRFTHATWCSHFQRPSRTMCYISVR